ncbi:uncharacterized protein LOC143184813 [Calliopsis andreniformis]|uniref:uncharacterized protein LOC143184813 n=1 Tax=Calliopsis andreniformis TaxID=337506 RepID=UPI003FCE663D
MRPYPGQQMDDSQKVIYNYRLSRARRVVENTFGILSQKFRIYNRRIECSPANIDYFILSTCILHNFIRKHDGKNVSTNNVDTPTTSASSSETNVALQNLPLQSGNSARAAFQVREILKEYFNEEGAVAWQNNRI